MNVWKVSPGGKAAMWNDCRDQGVISINWLNEVDFLECDDKSEIEQLLKKTGDPPNGAQSIWRFVHEINIGDLIVANCGLSEVKGIGVCQSEYLSPLNKANPFANQEYHRHVRKVAWIENSAFNTPRNFFGQYTVMQLDEAKQNQLKKLLKKINFGAVGKIEGAFSGKDDLSGDEGDAPFLPNKNAAKELITCQIKARRGQQAFRNSLMSRYSNTCVITGCMLVDVLEAAHIKPYIDQSDNHLSNGLLLRADIHTLFDLNLIAIDSKDYSIRLAPKLLDHSD